MALAFWGIWLGYNAFNKKGEWELGSLHGYVYVYINKGSNDNTEYEEPYRLQADGEDVDAITKLWRF
ncbi:hypothetical protein [Yeosuana marina]|uniref:hypothetical protein n=1 Tax=Yeosuana marina TaxID=1565536 RepID=UPI0030C7B6D7